ncbi:MAG TPA: mononuclear molybdenum enzyme YedY, partial [Gammaproteobacteria bacterium]|nr:mononuclear molybdenum enzyme YedY [Gammaproteobacteria bacterium]
MVWIRNGGGLTASDVTPEAVYRQRRRFMQAGAATLGSILAAPWLPAEARFELGRVKPGPFSTDEDKTPFDDVTGYNNFYEFGTGKRDPAR